MFDNVIEGDQIIAFFPCVRFEDQIQLAFRGTLQQLKNWTYEQKLEYDMKLHGELHNLYMVICKLAIVCFRRNIPLIIENPWSTTHYLRKYWCIEPNIIDKDRTERGDYFEKPTQYWFINRKPSNNLVFDAVAIHPKRRVTAPVKKGGQNRQVDRSMISHDYANRFIREFII